MLLLGFLTKICFSGRIPKFWLHFLIIPIHKPNEPIRCLLSLTSNLRKIMDEIVAKSLKARFHYERGKEHSFSLFIDLRLKRAVKIEASAKKINKTNKECFFSRS